MELSVKEHFSLKSYNTFGVAAFAAQFIEIDSEEALVHLFRNRKHQAEQRFLILGGGSNILFTKDFDGLVIRIGIPGISHRISETEVLVTAGAGVKWNDLVWYCVDRDFAGIENMALIPGTVGAAPVQNIGAYGTELKDVFVSCRAFDTNSGGISTFNKEDCEFSYRDSRFKKEAKGRYIITQVTLRLSLTPAINTSYGAIQTELTKRNITQPTIKDVAEVVSAIRTEKLPDPSTIGNSGSFFKNPVITVQHLQQLQFTFQDMNFVYYPVDESHVKLAAGWLIEQ